MPSKMWLQEITQGQCRRCHRTPPLLQLFRVSGDGGVGRGSEVLCLQCLAELRGPSAALDEAFGALADATAFGGAILEEEADDD